MIHSALDANTEISVATEMLGTDDAFVVKVNVFLDDVEIFASSATSRRDPQDSPNPETGLKLALGRALRQVGREILKDGQRLVRESDTKKKRQEQASLKALANKNLRQVTNALNAYNTWAVEGEVETHF